MILGCGAYTMEQGGKAQREPPPPRQPSASPRDCVVPTSCLRRACNGGETRRAPLPPHPPPPPRGRGMRVGRGRKAPPPPEGDAAGWGGRGRRVRDEPHDRARRGRAPCKPRRGDHRGCERRVQGATKGAARHTPPPLQRDGSRASCLRQESNEGETTRPAPPPHASAPPRVGDAGREGRTAPPPPEDKAARWRGSGERVRDGLHDRAQGKQAPSRPQRGGASGERTQSGKGEDGGHAASPTPQQKDKCRATCQCRACDVLTPEEGQRGRPPPRPQLPHPPRKGARATRGWRGGMGDDGSGRRTPPRGHRGRVARQWDESAERTTRPCPKGARAVRAPTGGPPGVQPQEG